MVTLIGFFFILANVGLCALLVPDLIGPVRLPQHIVPFEKGPQLTEASFSPCHRDRHGYTLASHSAYLCTRPWTT